MAILASQNGSPAGRANRVDPKTIQKSHPFFGNPIQVGCLIDFASVTTQCMGGVIIRHDEKDIGTRWLNMLGSVNLQHAKRNERDHYGTKVVGDSFHKLARFHYHMVIHQQLVGTSCSTSMPCGIAPTTKLRHSTAPLGLPGKQITSDLSTITARFRERMAFLVSFIDSSRITSPNPGSSRTAISRTASGVTSRNATPVPPVVSTR